MRRLGLRHLDADGGGVDPDDLVALLGQVQRVLTRAAPDVEHAAGDPPGFHQADQRPLGPADLPRGLPGSCTPMKRSVPA